jgi:hypothetical protein
MHLDIQLDTNYKHSVMTSKTSAPEVESGSETSNDDFEEEVDCTEHHCASNP